MAILKWLESRARREQQKEQARRDFLREARGRKNATALYETLTVAGMNPPESIKELGKRLPNKEEIDWFRRLGEDAKTRDTLNKILAFESLRINRKALAEAMEGG